MEQTSTYTGHGNCRRCGDEIPPYRYLCDVCRGVPEIRDNAGNVFNPPIGGTINFTLFDDKDFRRKIVMWIAEYAYRKANPNGAKDVPSVVYEQVEKDFNKFLELL